jgi:predicted acetyltransferase
MAVGPRADGANRVDITITPASLEEKPLLARLFTFYQYDFTEFTGEDVDDEGRFEAPHHFDSYWTEAERHPFLMRVDGHPAGFTLVRETHGLTSDDDVMDVAEFFVIRKYRRTGAGERMARHAWDAFPAKWEVRVLRANVPAQSFWRRIVGRYTGGRFEEIPWDDERWRGVVFRFDSRVRSPGPKSRE